MTVEFSFGGYGPGGLGKPPSGIQGQSPGRRSGDSVPLPNHVGANTDMLPRPGAFGWKLFVNVPVSVSVVATMASAFALQVAESDK